MNLEEIYAHLDAIPARFRGKLEAGRNSAFLSRDLATIRTNLQITLDFRAGPHRSYQLPGGRGLIPRARIPQPGGARAKSRGPPAKSADGSPAGPAVGLVWPTGRAHWQPGRPAAGGHRCGFPETLAELQARLAQAHAVAFDTETTGTNPLRARAELVGISLAVAEGAAYYIPVGHRSGTQLPLAQILAALRPALTDPAVRKIGRKTSNMMPWCWPGLA